jgi:hypothetical protein
MLNVSTMVELAVEAVVFVAVAVLTDVMYFENVAREPVHNVVVTVEDVVTAYVIEETVVETVGPSGCLMRPILLPTNSVNHTFMVPPVSL